MDNRKWYALYTRSKAEKKLALELQHAGIEYFLPLVQRLRQWSDRKKKVEEPLFRSYIFVKIESRDFWMIQNLPNAMRLVSFGGNPVEVPLQEILAIKHYINDPETEEEAEMAALTEGQLVRVKTGPMEGLIGRMVHYQNKFRLVVMIETIGQSIRLNIARTRVEEINDPDFTNNGHH